MKAKVRFETMTLSDGSHYEGEVSHKTRSMHGSGTLILKDGSRYVGQFSDGKKSGHGVLECPSGERYEGEWSWDKFHGHGEHFELEGNYVGEWKYGERHGKGRYVWNDGSTYDGEWAHSKRNGHGVLTYPSGDRFVGGFVDGHCSGHGRMEFGQGDVYVGDYLHGMYDGFGELMSAEGKYTGEFSNGAKHGIGCLSRKNGMFYYGEFVNEHPCGDFVPLDVLGEFLMQNGCSAHVKAFFDAGLHSVAEVAELTEDDLILLGVTYPGDRERIMIEAERVERSNASLRVQFDGFMADMDRFCETMHRKLGQRVDSSLPRVTDKLKRLTRSLSRQKHVPVVKRDRYSWREDNWDDVDSWSSEDEEEEEEEEEGEVDVGEVDPVMLRLRRLVAEANRGRRKRSPNIYRLARKRSIHSV